MLQSWRLKVSLEAEKCCYPRLRGCLSICHNPFPVPTFHLNSCKSIQHVSIKTLYLKPSAWTAPTKICPRRNLQVSGVLPWEWRKEVTAQCGFTAVTDLTKQKQLRVIPGVSITSAQDSEWFPWGLQKQNWKMLSHFESQLQVGRPLFCWVYIMLGDWLTG